MDEWMQTNEMVTTTLMNFVQKGENASVLINVLVQTTWEEGANGMQTQISSKTYESN